MERLTKRLKNGKVGFNGNGTPIENTMMLPKINVMCIKGIDEPLSIDEANEFIKRDLDILGYKTVVSITEIPEDEARQFFDWDAIEKAPVFKSR